MNDPTAFRPYHPVLVLSADPKDVSSLTPGLTGALAVGVEPAPGRLRELLPMLINGAHPFLLLLDAMPADAAEALGLCLFSPRYLRVEGRPVVATTGNTPIDPSALEALGWEDVLIWTLPGESFEAQLRDRTEGPIACRASSHSDPGGLFFSRWTNIGAYIFFWENDAERAFSTSCREALIRQAGESGMGLLTQAISAYLDEAARVNAMAEKQRVLEDRMRSSATIISVIRSKYKDDYDTLYKWHHNEYTVLPLWFKRLGQVVKVLTGKRTVRSLFHK